MNNDEKKITEQLLQNIYDKVEDFDEGLSTEYQMFDVVHEYAEHIVQREVKRVVHIIDQAFGYADIDKSKSQQECSHLLKSHIINLIKN